jgi:hypothetical protein
MKTINSCHCAIEVGLLVYKVFAKSFMLPLIDDYKNERFINDANHNRSNE